MTKTIVSIAGEQFHINGKPTYAGRSKGIPIEGMLLNSRMVQGTFDDENPETRPLWNYPDGPWDPDRNTREFIAAMPTWKAHGLLAFTTNLQGGSPQGYSKAQPWVNSAFTWDGELRGEYADRMGRVLDAAEPVLDQRRVQSDEPLPGVAVGLVVKAFQQTERSLGHRRILTSTGDASVIIESDAACRKGICPGGLDCPGWHSAIQ